MQGKIENLTERIAKLKDIMGEINFDDLSNKRESLIVKEKITSLSDILIKLHKEISENESATLKDVHKKFEELNPYLNVDKLTSEFNISENEMYVMISANFDELEQFLVNIKFIKDNHKILDYEPILDIPEKKKIINEKEVKSIEIYNDVYQIHESIDKLSKDYYQSIEMVNEKFFIFNKILDSVEMLNR